MGVRAWSEGVVDGGKTSKLREKSGSKMQNQRHSHSTVKKVAWSISGLR